LIGSVNLKKPSFSAGAGKPTPVEQKGTMDKAAEWLADKVGDNVLPRTRKGLWTWGSNMKPSHNRLLIGAVALFSQTGIDFFNPLVDRKTAENCAYRTAAQMIVTTCSGFLSRELGQWLGYKYIDWFRKDPPQEFIKLTSHRVVGRIDPEKNLQQLKEEAKNLGKKEYAAFLIQINNKNGDDALKAAQNALKEIKSKHPIDKNIEQLVTEVSFLGKTAENRIKQAIKGKKGDKALKAAQHEFKKIKYAQGVGNVAGVAAAVLSIFTLDMVLTDPITNNLLKIFGKDKPNKGTQNHKNMPETPVKKAGSA